MKDNQNQTSKGKGEYLSPAAEVRDLRMTSIILQQSGGTSEGYEEGGELGGN